MKQISELKNTLPQLGKVSWISIRPQRKNEVVSSSEIEVTLENGLEGDHYARPGGNRMVTLIQKEHIDTVGSFLRKEIDPALLRRNIVVEGINLNALKKAQFSIGKEVILEGTGWCHPCSRMEENLGPGGYNAMRGHGGITATVLKGGKIRIGDEVVLIKAGSDDSDI